jgi:hypothetical protein
MSNHELNREARCKVEAELLNRGASVESKSLGPLKVRLFATDAARRRTVELHVRARRKGSWHATTDEAKPITTTPDPQHVRNFSVFVDLGAAPRYWIVPDWWLGEDIHKAHQEYLRKHGGHRAQNDDSNHHSIQESRLAEWENRWEILGIL